jgi:hypothetical protein
MQNTWPLGEGPDVVVSRDSVVLNGNEVAKVADFAQPSRVPRVEGLFQGLKQIHDDFTHAHPGLSFPGYINIWADGRLTSGIIKSVFQTAAYAGFPHSCFVSAGAADREGARCIRIDARVPGANNSVGLPPNAIQSVVRSHSAELRRCYEAALARQPGLTGIVAVRFEIDPNGIVVDSRAVNSTLPDFVAVQCVVEAFRHFRFPDRSDGSATVVYPVSFAPSD